MIIRLVAAALTLAIVTHSAEARTFEEIKKDGKIIVATEGQFAPFNYFVGSKLAGFEVELAEMVAKKMGVPIEWKALSFDALLTGLRQERWDLVIASHAITEERAKAVTFTDPHYCTGGILVGVEPNVYTANDVAGKVVAVQTGTTYMDAVKKIGTAKETKTFPQDTDARSALAARRVDIWVTDKFVAKMVSDANPALKLTMGAFVSVERVAAVVAKGNTNLAQAYNAALAESMRDGSYAALSKKFFNDDIRCK